MPAMAQGAAMGSAPGLKVPGAGEGAPVAASSYAARRRSGRPLEWWEAPVGRREDQPQALAVLVARAECEWMPSETGWPHCANAPWEFLYPNSHMTSIGSTLPVSVVSVVCERTRLICDLLSAVMIGPMPTAGEYSMAQSALLAFTGT